MDNRVTTIEKKLSGLEFSYLVNNPRPGITNNKRHVHPHYELMYIDGGEIEFVVENRRYILKKGDVLIIKPGQYHYARHLFKPPYARYCIGFASDFVFDKRYAEGLLEKGEKFSIIPGSTFDMLAHSMKDMAFKKTEHDIVLFQSLIDAMLISLEDAKPDSKGIARSGNNFQRILSYINKNLSSINKIEDISGALFFSRSYIMHLFKSELRVGVMQYVRDKKILLAHQKIRKGEKPTDVYLMCGFSNYPSFYRAYTAYFGSSPKEAKPTK